ncbi:MAG: GNAT family N-acetyltransferase [Candidatus Methanoperedens sp.]|nr:GNAT family N-acetyltransferase [Candidatus Methanoperedens sp.]
MDIILRKTALSDIKDIKKLFSFYCLETENVEKSLSECITATLDERIVGCACLSAGNIVELRSIAVLPNYRNMGIGSKLVDAILKRAIDISDKVYLRTTSPAFFEKKGFRKLSHDMKKSIWKDCAECDKFNICKQTLMGLSIEKIK